MSCTVQLKARNTVKSKKVNNVIHRTTSETIRLGEPEVIINNSSRQVMTALAISPPPLKKSSCSFQVTSVSLTQRTDFGGDDSADDLDESHTDDISRVTDNETPSFSEDTCSRDADDNNYIGTCSALCSVTVIPSSSQYGLAIVPSEIPTVTTSNASESSLNSLTSKASVSTSAMSDHMKASSSPTKEEPVTTTANVPSSDVHVEASSPTTPAATTTSTRSARVPGTRFEIVKVETIRPFRRGRWLCMDYFDDSKYAPKNPLTYKSPDSPDISCTKPQPQYTMTATTTEVSPNKGCVDYGTNLGISQSTVPPTVDPASGQQGLVNPYYSNIVRQSQSYSTPISVPLQQIPHGPIDTLQGHSFVRQTSVPDTPRTRISNFCTQNQYFQNLPMSVPTAPELHQQIINPSQQPVMGQQAMSVSPNQGQLMSGGYVGVPNSQIYYAPQPAYISQAPVYISSPQIVTYPNLVETSQINMPETAQLIQPTYTPLQVQGQSFVTPTTQQYVVTAATAVTSDCSQVCSSGLSGKYSESSDSQSSGGPSHSSTRKSSLEPLVEETSLIVITQAQEIDTSVPSTGQGIATPTPTLSSAAAATSPAVPVVFASTKSEDRYKVITDFPFIRVRAANNTSAIIDTKIEQAMDLVKSHLMYTVREEVEVLKVRIAELLDRINQLEMENSFLKANASPEVLNALNSRAPQDPAQGNIPATTGAEGGAASK